MAKVHMSLHPTEVAVLNTASMIYAAYIKAGRVVDHAEENWLKKSVSEAIRLAKHVEENVRDGEELG